MNNFFAQIISGFFAITLFSATAVAQEAALAIVKIDGADKVVRITSKPDAKGNVVATWIEYDKNCRFGFICNNKQRTQTLDKRTAITSIAERNVTIDKTSTTLKPGMLISTKQGAIVRVDAVFSDGRISATQMEGRRLDSSNQIFDSTKLSGILRLDQLAGVQTNCVQNICVGSEIGFKNDKDKPLCTGNEIEADSFNPSREHKCLDLDKVLLAFSDGMLVKDIGGISFISDAKYIDIFSTYGGSGGKAADSAAGAAP